MVLSSTHGWCRRDGCQATEAPRANERAPGRQRQPDKCWFRRNTEAASASMAPAAASHIFVVIVARIRCADSCAVFLAPTSI